MNELAPPAPRTCAVYIDGFNAYYGVFKHRPATKWLNVQSYCEAVLNPLEVSKVQYFTAYVDEANSASGRQRAYFCALKSLPKVKFTFGKFQPKTNNCGLCFRDYKAPQEKKTDVNIALAMTVDAMSQTYDSMVLVSGDSDLHPVCQWIKTNRPAIELRVYIPAIPEQQPYRRADFLKEIGVPWGFLPLEELASNQFPDSVLMKWGATITRPQSWA